MATTFEKSLPFPSPRIKILTRTALKLPHITNQSFNSGRPSKIRAVVNKIKCRLDSQKKLTTLLSRASRGVRSKESRRKRDREQRPFALSAPANIGIVNVHCTRNNTLLTFMDAKGKVARGGWASAGSLGFKNSRKSTPYASGAAAKSIALKARQSGVNALHVLSRGTGRGKAAVVRTLNQSALKILSVRECTPAVHNGCRRPKIRRI